MVSYGNIEISTGKLTKARVGEIEQLLIYASNTDHLKNVKNFYDHKVTNVYRITNVGFRNMLPKMIYFGVFVGK